MKTRSGSWQSSSSTCQPKTGRDSGDKFVCDYCCSVSSLLPVHDVDESGQHRLEITVWFIPSLLENAIAISFVGMALGPMYPMVMSQAGRIIPRKVCTQVYSSVIVRLIRTAVDGIHWLDFRVWRHRGCRVPFRNWCIGQSFWNPCFTALVSKDCCRDRNYADIV